MKTPQETQIGGTHYRDMAIQPVTFITANKLSFLEGSVIERMCWHRINNGIEDLRMAIHGIELMIDLEYGSEVDAEDAAVAESRINEPMWTYPGPIVDIRHKIQSKLDELKEQDSEQELPSITGSGWHNPENVTQEQLGDGYRFLVPREVDGRYGVRVANIAQLYLSPGRWEGDCGASSAHYTYRVPASTPIPPKPI